MTLAALLYHAVRPSDASWAGDALLRLSVSDREFRGHLAALGSYAELVDLTTALRHGRSLDRSTNRYLTITFDDAYAISLEVAQQALREAGAPAAVFVPGAHVTDPRPYWWDAVGVAAGTGAWLDAPPDDALDVLRELRKLRHADALDAVRKLVAPEVWASCPDGPASVQRLGRLDPAVFTVASHGWWHENLSLVPDSELRRDLRAAGAVLADLGLPVAPALAYPFGREGFVSWEQIRDIVGLEHCYGMLSETGRMYGVPPTNPLALRRCYADHTDPAALVTDLDAVLTGGPR